MAEVIQMLFLENTLESAVKMGEKETSSGNDSCPSGHIANWLKASFSQVSHTGFIDIPLSEAPTAKNKSKHQWIEPKVNRVNNTPEKATKHPLATDS